MEGKNCYSKQNTHKAWKTTGRKLPKQFLNRENEFGFAELFHEGRR
jgi:hypothetical protein